MPFAPGCVVFYLERGVSIIIISVLYLTSPVGTVLFILDCFYIYNFIYAILFIFLLSMLLLLTLFYLYYTCMLFVLFVNVCFIFRYMYYLYVTSPIGCTGSVYSLRMNKDLSIYL